MGRRTNTAVWLEKYKRWQIKVQKDGERKTFTCSVPGRNGQRECNRKADDWLDQNLDRTGTRFNVLFGEWIEELKLLTGTDHWQQYERYGRLYILKPIGNIKMGDLNEQHLQKVINAAYRKGLSKKTLSNIRACMAAFVKYGRKCKATSLVVENVTVPRNAPVKEKIILQPQDLVTLFKVDTVTMHNKTKYDLFVNAYRFAVITGLRPGELVGLERKDIKGEMVRLRRSINIHNEVTKGKNENAQRTFMLTPLAQKVLQDQFSKLEELGIESEAVFPDQHGDHVSQSTYSKRWARYRDQNGLSKATPYELRHTFVSLVKRLPEGLVKPLVGHSKDMYTYGTYGHEVIGDMQTTTELIQGIFSKYIK